MLEVAADRRERDADRLRQFLDRGRPALADVLEHEGPALRGYELRTAGWDHGCSVRLRVSTRWIANTRRCFSLALAPDSGRKWQFTVAVNRLKRWVGRFGFGWSRVGLLRGRPAALGPGDRFGFSWRVAVSPRNPPIVTIGFPWISLDSLV